MLIKKSYTYCITLNTNIMFLLCLVTQGVAKSQENDIVDLFSISFTEVVL